MRLDAVPESPGRHCSSSDRRSSLREAPVPAHPSPSLLGARLRHDPGNQSPSPTAASPSPAAQSPSGSAASAPSASPLDLRRRARRRPPRAGLDPEHRSHGVLRRRAKGWYGEPASTCASCRTPPPRPRRYGRPPGGLRDQLPGLDDVRGRGGRRHGQRRRDPPEDGVGDRRAGRRPDPAAEGARRQDLRRLRLPNEDPDAEVRDPGRRRDGHVQDRDPRHRGVRGAVQPPGRLHDPVHGLGGRRGEQRGIEAALLPVRRLRLPGLLPGRPRLRSRLARRQPGRRAAVRRRDRRAASRSRPTSPTRRRRMLVVGEPGRVRREHGPPDRQPGVPGDGRLPRRRRGQLRNARPSSDGRPTRSSCTTRASWWTPPASRCTKRARLRRRSSRTTFLP